MIGSWTFFFIFTQKLAKTPLTNQRDIPNFIIIVIKFSGFSTDKIQNQKYGNFNIRDC